MAIISLEVFPREVLGKKVKALRRTDIVPLHVYGRGMPSQSLQGNSSAVTRLIAHVGHNVPLYLNLAGGQDQDLVFVREVQRHPVSNRVLHVDFFRVNVSDRVTGEVPIILTGEAPAVRVLRGILNQSLHHLSVECLPMEMPERIEVDISHLEELEQGIRVEELAPGPGITVLSPPEELVVRVGTPRIAAEVEQGAAEVPVEAPAATEGAAESS